MSTIIRQKRIYRKLSLHNDNGIPFDPTKVTVPDITAGIEDRNI